MKILFAFFIIFVASVKFVVHARPQTGDIHKGIIHNGDVHKKVVLPKPHPETGDIHVKFDRQEILKVKVK